MSTPEPPPSTPAAAPGTGSPASSAAGTPAASGSAPAGSAPAGSAPAGSVPAKLAKDEATALQAALRAENAALWAYALVAGGDPDNAETVTTVLAAHLQRRDNTAGILLDGGVTPTPPASAYTAPAVTDAASARKLALTIEQDCTTAWQAVVTATDRAALRASASVALNEAAIHLVQWRQIAKANPATLPFPGLPG